MRQRGRLPAAAAIVVGAFAVALVSAVAIAGVPTYALLAYLLSSVLLFAMYAADKAAAREGRWRTSEASLHLVALLGGWPGGLIARHVLRHKTHKQPFRTIFWMTVVLNCVALASYAATAATGVAR